MEILWTSAFIDMGAQVFDGGARFWAKVAGATLSKPRGEHAESATLLPIAGDPYLRVQRTRDGHSGIHLDLHVRSVADSCESAVDLGARVLFDRGYIVLSSPGGFVFCLVSHHGEQQVPSATGLLAQSRIDQVCIDIPPAMYEQECVFWSALTGWETNESALRAHAGFGCALMV